MHTERRTPVQSFAADAKFQLMHSVLKPEPYGVDEMVKMNEQSFGMSSDMQGRPLRITDLGNNTYLAEVYLYGTFDGPLGPAKPTHQPIGMRFLEVVKFNSAGKIASLQIWRNEVAMMESIGMMPPAFGKRPAPLPMPTGEMVVQKVDAATNPQLLSAFEKFSHTSNVRPFDAKGFAATIAADVQLGTPPQPERGKAFWVKEQTMFAAGISDRRTEVVATWSVGDILIVEGVQQAKHTGDIGPFKATHKNFDHHFFELLKFDGQTIVAASNYGNPLHSLKQLGLFPPPSSKPKSKH